MLAPCRPRRRTVGEVGASGLESWSSCSPATARRRLLRATRLGSYACCRCCSPGALVPASPRATMPASSSCKASPRSRPRRGVAQQVRSRARSHLRPPARGRRRRAALGALPARCLASACPIVRAMPRGQRRKEQCRSAVPLRLPSRFARARSRAQGDATMRGHTLAPSAAAVRCPPARPIRSGGRTFRRCR